MTPKALISITIVIICIAYLTSPYANTSNTVEYTKNLEKVLAICLTPGENPLWIGDELYMCSAYKTGERK